MINLISLLAFCVTAPQRSSFSPPKEIMRSISAGNKLQTVFSQVTDLHISYVSCFHGELFLSENNRQQKFVLVERFCLSNQCPSWVTRFKTTNTLQCQILQILKPKLPCLGFTAHIYIVWVFPFNPIKSIQLRAKQHLDSQCYVFKTCVWSVELI